MGIGVAVAVIGALTLLAAASSFLPHILKTPKHTRILGSLQLLAGEYQEETARRYRQAGMKLMSDGIRAEKREREEKPLTINVPLISLREGERNPLYVSR